MSPLYSPCCTSLATICAAGRQSSQPRFSRTQTSSVNASPQGDGVPSTSSVKRAFSLVSSSEVSTPGSSTTCGASCGAGSRDDALDDEDAGVDEMPLGEGGTFALAMGSTCSPPHATPFATT